MRTLLLLKGVGNAIPCHRTGYDTGTTYADQPRYIERDKKTKDKGKAKEKGKTKYDT